MDVAQLAEITSATTLEEAARRAATALAEYGPVGVSVVDDGQRRQIVGDPDLPLPTTGSATAREGIIIEVGAEAGHGQVTTVAVALAVLVDRFAAEEAVDTARRRLRATEQLGGLGWYDWEIGTGRLRWSNELFRIYGHEPEAFEPTYERFLAMVEPEDRERLQRLHREAVETGEGFETEERIVRPDGQSRILQSNGMVVTDADGQPLRLHGVCRDVTDERASRDQARRSAGRLEKLIEASPDAVLVVDAQGRIASSNPRALRLFGYAEHELIGMRVDDLVPDHTRERHGQLRAEFMASPSARSMAAGADLQARRADGSLVAVDIALNALDEAAGGVVAAFVRDATLRRRAERDRRELAEASIRRRQALELNDNVVQGLVALLWSLDDGVAPAARRTAQRTLASARRIMGDLLEDLPEDPGGLVRHEPLDSEIPPAAPIEPVGDVEGTIRVVIADDDAGLRQLLRMRLVREEGIEVVAEAADGEQAVEVCVRVQPDLVLLDLSMPSLDGLEVAPRIRQRCPHTRIVVLSGYPATAMEERALDAGAHAYHEKGSDLDALCDVVAETQPTPT